MRLIELLEGNAGWPDLYHGSENTFSAYDARKGRPGQLRGDSFVYTTPDPEVAKTYGPQVYQVRPVVSYRVMDISKPSDTLLDVLTKFQARYPTSRYAKWPAQRLYQIVLEGRMFVKDEYGNLQKDLLSFLFKSGYTCVILRDNSHGLHANEQSWVFAKASDVKMEMAEAMTADSKPIRLPRVKLPKVYHVGSMDQTQKSGVSYEGNGLSVSLHPDEWREIARGQVSGDTWVLTKPTGNFINAHKITGAGKRFVIAWGTEMGYLDLAVMYRVEWYDDEMEDTMSTLFPSYEEAAEEADYVDGTVTQVPGSPVATPKLDQVIGFKVDPMLAYDMVLTQYVESMTDADGIWWADQFDPSRLSAPRGVIFADRVNQWTINRMDQDITERRIQNTEIMYHGTTDKHLRSILKQGLLANPPKRTWSGEDDMETGYETFGGVYLANTRRKALAAAMDAVSKFGGNAILVIVQYVQGSGNMDEDMFTNVISQDVYNAMIAYEEQVEDNPESSKWDTYHEYAYYNRDQAVNDLVASATEHFERYGRFGEAFLPNLRAAFEYVLYHVDDDMITGSSKSLMTSLRDHPEFIKIIENLMRNLFPTKSREAQDLAVQITRNIGFRGKTKIIRIETTRGEVLWENPAAPTVGDY